MGVGANRTREPWYPDCTLTPRARWTVSHRSQFVGAASQSGPENSMTVNPEIMSQAMGAGPALSAEPRGPEADILKSLAAHAALLDGDGIIRWTNDSWQRELWARQGSAPSFGLGASYVDFCRALVGDSCEKAAALMAGVRCVLQGEQEFFWLEYVSPWSTAQQWHCVTVNSLRATHREGAVIMHLNVSDLRARDELLQNDLQSQKLEVLGRLASGVAHDFANLLTLISGYSEIVLNRMTLLDPLRAELEEIRKAANRGAGMTAQLLD